MATTNIVRSIRPTHDVAATSKVVRNFQKRCSHIKNCLRILTNFQWKNLPNSYGYVVEMLKNASKISNSYRCCSNFAVVYYSSISTYFVVLQWFWRCQLIENFCQFSMSLRSRGVIEIFEQRWGLVKIVNQSTSQLLCCENVNSFWCQKQVKIFFVKFLCRNDIENWFKISITNCRSHCDVRYWSYCSTKLRRSGNGESWPKFPTNLRGSNVAPMLKIGQHFRPIFDVITGSMWRFKLLESFDWFGPP